ncbi:hypothetical protein ROZALSC1DRAFT_28583 [Rozella allomycis CSF55]|uniref:Uncharacterized protein n=1 Tax=Rozella allomycis (strain CSF55) TaxID=988480 RepID=A0A4P9YMQ4_ROZAC|nr:hypothetical protein ROZALSC1DRAFT_28583 [Rozella allomycis CSF55]
MGFLSKTIWAIFLVTAYASNPDEESFEKYIESILKKQGSNWFEQRLISQLSSLVTKRHNFYVFSIAHVSLQDMWFIGAFGKWFVMPNSMKRHLNLEYGK